MKQHHRHDRKRLKAALDSLGLTKWTSVRVIAAKADLPNRTCGLLLRDFKNLEHVRGRALGVGNAWFDRSLQTGFWRLSKGKMKIS